MGISSGMGEPNAVRIAAVLFNFHLKPLLKWDQLNCLLNGGWLTSGWWAESFGVLFFTPSYIQDDDDDDDDETMSENEPLMEVAYFCISWSFNRVYVIPKTDNN